MKYVLYDIMGNRINYIRDNMGKYGNIMDLIGMLLCNVGKTIIKPNFTINRCNKNPSQSWVVKMALF